MHRKELVKNMLSGHLFQHAFID